LRITHTNQPLQLNLALHQVECQSGKVSAHLAVVNKRLMAFERWIMEKIKSTKGAKKPVKIIALLSHVMNGQFFRGMH